MAACPTSNSTVLGPKAMRDAKVRSGHRGRQEQRRQRCALSAYAVGEGTGFRRQWRFRKENTLSINVMAWN